MRSRAPRLYGDDELRVLWLSQGRQELALSTAGVWLRSGWRRIELVWDEIDQVQAVRVGLPWRRARLRLEVFLREGSVYTVGPFAAAEAARWLRACAQAAAEHGERLVPVAEGEGFALVH